MCERTKTTDRKHHRFGLVCGQCGPMCERMMYFRAGLMSLNLPHDSSVHIESPNPFLARGHHLTLKLLHPLIIINAFASINNY